MRLGILSVSRATAFVLKIQVSAVQQRPAPIPAKIIRAKTVFLENQSGYDRVRDAFADELGKWNRLHIVYGKTGAGLGVGLTAPNAQRRTSIAFFQSDDGRQDLV